MKHSFNTISLIAICLIGAFGFSQEKIQGQMVIVGAGAGGTAAAIQAARMGVEVHLISENPWLGGMLTAAGVSAIDGNHQLPSGIWGEFRAALYAHYGGPEGVATGWVSNTHFEPAVGDSILKAMAALPSLKIHYNSIFTKVERKSGTWNITFKSGLEVKSIQAEILIDATETGALLPLVGAHFDIGMDARSVSQEVEAPIHANEIVQDLTYTLILKDLGRQAAPDELVQKHPSYNQSLFECACRLPGVETPKDLVDHKQMLAYAALPNNKYLINWPNCGNDYYLDWPQMCEKEVSKGLASAKQHSLNFVYYIQQVLGFKNLAVYNEFGTQDSFPWIPYHRESRRVHGLVTLNVNHLRTPYVYNLFKTGIAVGDYPIDHHHDKNPDAPEIDFIGIKVPSYNVPLGSLIPKGLSNFIVAEKNISVTNIVNGASRLQPVVLGVGQAAGALAATAIKNKQLPSEVPVRKVQAALLASGAYLMPYIDVKPASAAFAAIQRIGATGILKGTGVPFKWANQTWFYPESAVPEFELLEGLKPYYPMVGNLQGSGAAVRIDFLNQLLKTIDPRQQLVDARILESLGLQALIDPSTPAVNKGALAQLIDLLLDPFSIQIDHQGDTIRQP